MKIYLLYKLVYIILGGLIIFAPSSPLFAQDNPNAADLAGETPENPAAPAQVDIQPQARDEEIAKRLTRILIATEWFIDPQAEVRDGVVFLRGQTRREEWRLWAGDLARNTQDVVAVVNHIEELPRPFWDFTPAWVELRTLWRDSVQALPLLAFGLLLLAVTLLLTGTTVRIARHLVKDRLPSPLLANVISWSIAAPIFLIGVYTVLRIAGLTQLALTVLGGTGLAGLVIGIAFRDIAENFLASILLSIRNPFRAGDRIDVAGLVGVVQRVTTRGTILMTLDGNHVQIPNSTVYKSTITNYTANPSRRMEFTVGIGYETAKLFHDALAAQNKINMTPDPPRGALVFSESSWDRGAGHVDIAHGDGTFVSGGVGGGGPTVQVLRTWNPSPGARYLGWAYAPW